MVLPRFRPASAAVLVAVGIAGLAVPAAAAPTTRAVADCQASPESGSYPPGSASIRESRTEGSPGTPVTVHADGFAPEGAPGHDQTVALTFCSSPVSVGSATIAPDGSITYTITVPQGEPAGQHVIQAQGPNGNGGTVTLTTGFVIPATVAPATAQSGSLPFTGFDLIPIILAGVGLVVVGGGVVVASRRRTVA